jgi:hypothetical protein
LFNSSFVEFVGFLSLFFNYKLKRWREFWLALLGFYGYYYVVDPHLFHSSGKGEAAFEAESEVLCKCVGICCSCDCETAIEPNILSSAAYVAKQMEVGAIGAIVWILYTTVKHSEIAVFG